MKAHTKYQPSSAKIEHFKITLEVFWSGLFLIGTDKGVPIRLEIVCLYIEWVAPLLIRYKESPCFLQGLSLLS